MKTIVLSLYLKTALTEQNKEIQSQSHLTDTYSWERLEREIRERARVIYSDLVIFKEQNIRTGRSSKGRTNSAWWNCDVYIKVKKFTETNENVTKIFSKLCDIWDPFSWPIIIVIVITQGLRDKTIGHFRVPKNLTFKVRLSAKPLIWKWFLITVEPRFNEVAGDRPNLFVKSRVR